jgi:hypothetical protein
MKKPALVCWFGFLVILPLILGAHQVPSSTRISSSTTGINRFAQDISNTRLSEVDRGVLKAAVSDFYLNYAPLLAAYHAKASTGKATGYDTKAFNKAKYLLALDAYGKALQHVTRGIETISCLY